MDSQGRPKICGSTKGRSSWGTDRVTQETMATIKTQIGKLPI